MSLLIINSMAMLYGIYLLFKKSAIPVRMLNHDQNYQSFKKSDNTFKVIVITELDKYYWEEIPKNFKGLLLSCPVIGLTVFIVDSSPTWTFLALLIGIAVPIFILDYRKKKIEQSIDRDMFPFLSRVNTLLSDNEDFIDALKNVERKVANPFIQKGLRYFNAAIRAGLTPELAFNQLQSRTHHLFLKYLYINIEQAYSRRGDVVELMRGLENEYTSVQVEMNKRNMELTRYRDKTIFSVVLVLLTGLKMVTDDDYLLNFYFSHPIGNAMMVLLILGFILGFMFIGKAMRLGRTN